MNNLDQRKSDLLKLVVRQHIETAEPIGSSWLAEQLDVSSATVRNEMAALEDAGLLTQPHTSAGRIPTEAGYKHYIRHFMKKKQTPVETVEAVEMASRASEAAVRLREVAKAMAEFSQETALVGFGPRDVYYTGISNLFSKPEFRAAAHVTTMSKVLDHLDEVMEKVFTEVEDDIQIRVGSENPFGSGCSVLMTRVPFGETKGIMALLGPMRMDYESAHSLLETAVQILSAEPVKV